MKLIGYGFFADSESIINKANLTYSKVML